MNRSGHDNIRFFVGTEIEKTPAHGMRTLFVVGVQDHAEVTALAHEHKCQHIYFGANHSFPNPETNNSVVWAPWEKMIDACIMQGFICTLDIDVRSVEGLLESFLVEHNNFIPMISVKLPYSNQLGYNATIKIDDRDFNATTPGVWVHSLHDLKSRDRFTAWHEYQKDQVIV